MIVSDIVVCSARIKEVGGGRIRLLCHGHWRRKAGGGGGWSEEARDRANGYSSSITADFVDGCFDSFVFAMSAEMFSFRGVVEIVER